MIGHLFEFELIMSKNKPHGNQRHGLSHHPIHRLWDGIKHRCNNSDSQDYHNYGGRGITVCDKWNNSFELFYEWAINNGWQTGLQIDRYPDNNGNYEPNNCRFVTSKENNNNRRNNIKIQYGDNSYSLSQLVKHFNCVSYGTAKERIRTYNWDTIKACSTPAGQYVHRNQYME
jgi:hypothetical protein